MADCSMRAIWSDAPPAPAATTISTVLVGSHALAPVTPAPIVSAAIAAVVIAFRIISSPWFSPFEFSAALFVELIRPCPSCDGHTCNLDDLVFGFAFCLENIHRGQNAAALVRDAGNIQSHFNACERSHQHQVVEVTEMTNAECPTLQPAEARAERHVEIVENDLAEAIRIVTFRHEYRRRDRRILVGFDAHRLET